jgi:DNA-binding NtrC family response regulator
MTDVARVVIVDDDRAIRWVLERALASPTSRSNASSAPTWRSAACWTIHPMYWSPISACRASTAWT